MGVIWYVQQTGPQVAVLKFLAALLLIVVVLAALIILAAPWLDELTQSNARERTRIDQLRKQHRERRQLERQFRR